MRAINSSGGQASVGETSLSFALMNVYAHAVGVRKHAAGLRQLMMEIVSAPLSSQTWVGEASTSVAPLSVEDYDEEDTDEALGSVVAESPNLLQGFIFVIKSTSRSSDMVACLFPLDVVSLSENFSYPILASFIQSSFDSFSQTSVCSFDQAICLWMLSRRAKTLADT
ncbi:hypothetical protein Tco_0116105 [Tanacetum coccineum]